MIKTDYGSLLKEMRLRAGFTQEKLAAVLHRTKSCISKFEKGDKLPDIATFVAWAYATGETERAALVVFGVELINNAQHFVSMMFTFWLV